MTKFILFLFWSALCIGIALIPEIAMYFTWGLIAPSTDFARIALVALFWVAGGSFCVVFAFIGFILWATGVQALADTRF